MKVKGLKVGLFGFKKKGVYNYIVKKEKEIQQLKDEIAKLQSEKNVPDEKKQELTDWLIQQKDLASKEQSEE